MDFFLDFSKLSHPTILTQKINVIDINKTNVIFSKKVSKTRTQQSTPLKTGFKNEFFAVRLVGSAVKG